MKYSLIIPVFNSAATLEQTVSAVNNELLKHADDFEIILTDDASDDNSWEVMMEIKKTNPKVKIIQLAKNVGQLAAVFCGASKAHGEFIITYDDDMQYPAEEISKLILESNTSSYPLIYGVPIHRKYSFKAKLFSLVFRMIIQMTMMRKYVPKGYFYSSFRLFSKKLFHAMVSYPPGQYKHFDIFTLWTLPPEKIKFIPVNHHTRRHGKSGQTFSKKIKDAIDNSLCFFNYFPYGLIKFILSSGLISIPILFILSQNHLTTYILLLLFGLVFIQIIFFSIITLYLVRIYSIMKGQKEFFIINEL